MTQLIERKEEKKITRHDLAKKMDAMHERDNEKITGIFRYIEHPGGTLRFIYKKYQQDPLQQYELKDGERYKLPRMVVRHINNDVHYREYKKLNSQFGDQIHCADDGQSREKSNMWVQNKRPRCEFKSLEFMDEDLEPSRIIEVAKKA